MAESLVKGVNIQADQVGRAIQGFMLCRDMAQDTSLASIPAKQDSQDPSLSYGPDATSETSECIIRASMHESSIAAERYTPLDLIEQDGISYFVSWQSRLPGKVQQRLSPDTPKARYVQECFCIH